MGNNPFPKFYSTLHSHYSKMFQINTYYYPAQIMIPVQAMLTVHFSPPLYMVSSDKVLSK